MYGTGRLRNVPDLFAQPLTAGVATPTDRDQNSAAAIARSAGDLSA